MVGKHRARYVDSRSQRGTETRNHGRSHRNHVNQWSCRAEYGFTKRPFDRGSAYGHAWPNEKRMKLRESWFCYVQPSPGTFKAFRRCATSLQIPKPTDRLALRSRFRRIRSARPLLQRPDANRDKTKLANVPPGSVRRGEAMNSTGRNGLFCNTVKRGCIVWGEKAAVNERVAVFQLSRQETQV